MRHARERKVTVALLGTVAVGLFVFVAIAREVVEGEMRALDEALLLALRNAADLGDPLGPGWLEEAAVEITALGGYPVVLLVVALVLGYLVVDRKAGAALFVLFSVSGGALVSAVLKSHFERPRPDLVDQLDVIHTSSFPSAHAMVTTVVYLTLGALVVRFIRGHVLRVYVFAGAVLIAFLVGLSRVYLGVHWPTDVVAGWSLGAAWATLCWLAVSWLRTYRSRRKGEHATATEADRARHAPAQLEN